MLATQSLLSTVNIVSASQRGSPLVCTEQQGKALGTEHPAEQKKPGVFGSALYTAYWFVIWGSSGAIVPTGGMLRTELRLKPTIHTELSCQLKMIKNNLGCRGLIGFAPIFL